MPTFSNRLKFRHLVYEEYQSNSNSNSSFLYDKYTVKVVRKISDLTGGISLVVVDDEADMSRTSSDFVALAVHGKKDRPQKCELTRNKLSTL